MVNQKNLSIDEYINMIALKTGALIEKSLLIGASYAKIDEKIASYLSTVKPVFIRPKAQRSTQYS